MDNTMENTTELNLNEMEEISGGAGGYAPLQWQQALPG